MPVKIAASLMCANLLDLARDIRALERGEVDLLHIDVMDGHFVPNLALSFELAEKVVRNTQVPVDLHLMVARPENFIEAIRRVGPLAVSYHIESTVSPVRLTRTLKAMGIQVGVALNPSTPAEAIRYLVEEVDFALLMTVEPGFAGQKFIPQVLPKIRTVRQMLDSFLKGRAIVVDGNLTPEWAKQCIVAGATVLVAGTSSLFREGADLYTTCRDFRAHVNNVEQQRVSAVSLDLLGSS